MTSPLRIVRVTSQPLSGSGPAAAKRAKEALLAARAASSSQEIGFFGHTALGEVETFSVLAGDGAPTVTGGWARIALLERPGRVSFTVPSGYDPVTMTVPILFDAVAKTKDRADIEADIKKLEWMAGRSTEEALGEPPYVEVFTLDDNGNTIALVPEQYQSKPGRSQQWFISGIEFDTEAIRDRSGSRLRQAATVTLTEIITTPGVIAKNRKSREAVKNKNETVFSTSEADTIKKVAAREGIPSSWKAILAANRKLGSSAEKHLKPHTAIKIPLTAFRQVPK